MANDNDKNLKSPAPLGLPPDLNSMGDSPSGSDASLEDAETERGDGKLATSPDVHEKAGGQINEARAASDASDNLPLIEGYRIDRKLGQGGMGSVFLATDQTLMRQVAIKVVAQTFQENTGLRDRFESEIQTLAALQHPHIAQLFSAGSCQDLPYFVMEFVEGSTLEAFATQPLKPRQVATIVSQLCSAVAYCHENGVLHRDLKPSNVLLDEQQQPKIADFGLAKAIGVDTSSTRTGEILGTPGYMSPEQASGVVKSFTAACDIYALGAILYRLLTGRPPFVAAEPLQAIMQVLADEPIPPRKLVGSIPNDLQTICLKCLEKKSGRRYQSASELNDDLQRFLDGRPITARPTGAIEKSIKWVKRNPAKALAVSAVGVLAVAVLGGLSWHNQLLADELAKTKRLADHGSELSKWLINDHLASLNMIAGTTKPRLQVAERVREFLDASYVDIPPDPKYTRELGSSYARLADISGGDDQNSLGLHNQAVEYYQRALELYDQAAQKDHSDRKVKKLRVSSLMALSMTYQEMGKPDESNRYLKLAKTHLNELDLEDWEAKILEIRIVGREAQDLMSQNQFNQALTAWTRFEGLLEASRENALAREWEHQEILLAIKRGECQSSMGQTELAEASFRESVRLSEQAAKAGSDDVLLQRRWSSSLDRLGHLLFEQDKPAEALEQYRLARDISKQIVEADADSVESAIALASKYTNIGDVLFYQQNVEEAKKAVDESIRIYQSVQEKGQLGLTGKRQLAVSIQSKANILLLMGQTDSALEVLEQHQKLCLGLITIDRDSLYELNQLGENHFQRSLVLLSPWMENGFDPSKARESKEYLQIKGELKQSQAYFDRIAQAGTLSANQQDYQKRIGAVGQLIEDAIDQLLEAEKAEDSGDAEDSGEAEGTKDP